MYSEVCVAGYMGEVFGEGYVGEVWEGCLGKGMCGELCGGRMCEEGYVEE